MNVLHLGDQIRYNADLYNKLFSNFTVISPPLEQRRRPEFIKALKNQACGDFHALMRPIMFSGTEMGVWDKDLISLLPSTVKVFASAGAGYDTIDVGALPKRGKSCQSSR
jgi:phosphoglycerate dehydrogenase-like enzyme